MSAVNLKSKSVIARKDRQKTLQELQISEELKKQAEELTIGYKFENWEHIDQVLYTYDKTKGFIWRLQNTYYRVDKSIKKVFECHHAGKPRSNTKNNTTQAKKSSRVECTCYINICWPKTDSNPHVTTFEPEHANYTLNLVTAKFAPSYRSLPEPVLDRISFYINNSPRIGSFMIRNLLIAEFSQHTLLERDIVNAIQRFKQDNVCNKINNPDNDAFLLLNMLENQQNDDAGLYIAKKINNGRTNKYSMALCLFVGVDNRNHIRVLAQALLSDETSTSYTWVFEQLLNANDQILLLVLISDADTGLDAAVKTFLPTVKHIHCIFHIRQNLDRHIQSSLGQNYHEFLAKFYLAYNSLNEALFEVRWNHLIELFPSTNSYLMETLDKIKESWAKAFICTVNNSEAFNETEPDPDLTVTHAEQTFIDINGNLSYINISQSPTVLEMKILDELHENENTNESNSKTIINPYIVKSKGRPRNKRFKSSVETNKSFNKNNNPNIYIQNNKDEA
ncbi:17814_t:CDS:2, partial [Racocetra fulgida]